MPKQQILYIFYWVVSGKHEEPLQAVSEKQALYRLIERYKRKYGERFDKFKILNAFRNGDLSYKTKTPFQEIPKEKRDEILVQKKKEREQAAKEPPGHQQTEFSFESFKEFVKRSS